MVLQGKGPDFEGQGQCRDEQPAADRDSTDQSRPGWHQRKTSKRQGKQIERTENLEIDRDTGEQPKTREADSWAGPIEQQGTKGNDGDKDRVRPVPEPIMLLDRKQGDHQRAHRERVFRAGAVADSKEQH